jgi:pimeloyl-ACP methyl ester carboxylesterase
MFVDVNGTRLHVVSLGRSERTLLAVGGWAGSWEVWLQPFELLTANGWRCVGYDHRGAGESPSDEITVDALVGDVFGVMDALGIERCVLAGESMGAAICLRAAVQRPERFDGLVLASTAAGRFTEGSAAFAAATRRDYRATVEAFMELCVPETDAEHVKRWGRNILLRAEPEHAARLTEMWRDAAPVDAAQVTVPTLLVHGTADAVAPIDHARTLAGAIPDAELVEFAGTGHVPPMTRPQDVVAAIERRYPKP